MRCVRTIAYVVVLLNLFSCLQEKKSEILPQVEMTAKDILSDTNYLVISYGA